MSARPVQPVVFMDGINRNEPAEPAASFSDWAASRKPVEPATPENDPERFAFRNRDKAEVQPDPKPEHPAFDQGDIPDV